MTHYTSNAVYEALDAAGTRGRTFQWAAGNAWFLVHGSQRAEPRMLVLVLDSTAQRSPEYLSLAKDLGSLAQVPTFAIEIEDRNYSIEHVELLDLENPARSRQVSLPELRTIYGAHLDLSHMAVAKQVNSVTSGTYHDWQRNSLGGAITVTDLDLFRLRGATISEICELKRSFTPVDQWKPYPQDYVNFRLASRFADKVGVPFNIAYNMKTKTLDDPSALSIFSYSARPDDQVAHLGVVQLSEFVAGT